MVYPEHFILVVSLSWCAGGALFGQRYGCFAAMGLGFVAACVGFALALILLCGHDTLGARCGRLADRRPRLGSALATAELQVAAALYGVLLCGPVVVLLVTRLPAPG